MYIILQLKSKLFIIKKDHILLFEKLEKLKNAHISKL